MQINDSITESFDKPPKQFTKEGALDSIEDVSDETSEQAPIPYFDVQYPRKESKLYLPKVNYKTNNSDLADIYQE